MIQLPRVFKPTHPTGGLDGYPAIDVFGDPGEPVLAPATGRIRRFSGKDPVKGGSPGGPYGWSMYLAADNGDDYYLTHFANRHVRLGERVVEGHTILGTICNSAVSGKPNTSHIHEGRKAAKNPPKPPSERLLDVLGPKGNPIARRKKAADVSRALPRWIKRFGSVTVRTARSPEAKQ